MKQIKKSCSRVRIKRRTYTPIKHLEYVLRSKLNVSAHLQTIKKYRVCAKKMCEKSLRNFKNSLHSCTKNREKNKFRKMKKIQVEIK